MAASVFPFQWPTTESQDWSNQERADIWRIAEKLALHGVAVDVATGLSEDGDPWCCFIDPEKGEAVAHFARIDGEFVAVHVPRDEVVRGRDLREVSERLLLRYFVPANQNNPHLVEVLGHPVAVLAAFVLTALELSRTRAPDPMAGLQALFADATLGEEGLPQGDPAATLAAALALASESGTAQEVGGGETADDMSGESGIPAFPLRAETADGGGEDGGGKVAGDGMSTLAHESGANAEATFLGALDAEATPAGDGAEGLRIAGTSEADMLAGTAGDDTIHAGAGDDRVSAGAGDDQVYGGAGDDTLDGGEGDDTLDGGDGNDSLDGGAGDDTLLGGEGADTLNGGDGKDSLAGGSGDDSLAGGAEDDALEGGAGNDSLDGGAGNDLILGGGGSDTLEGGDGHDMLLGGVGPDLLFGDAGNDTLVGGDGDDTLHGGEGDDSLDGGDGDDVLTSRSGDDTLSGGPGDDTFFNDNPTGRVLLSGDEGQDAFYNLSGDATISGGDGSDIINITFDSGHVRLESFELGIDWLYISSGLLKGEETPRTAYNADGDAVLWLDDDASVTFAGLDTLPDQIL